MIQQKIENDLSGQLQFQDAGRIEGEFPHGPFQDVNGGWRDWFLQTDHRSRSRP